MSGQSDLFLSSMLRQLSEDRKEQLAYRWITRIATLWLFPMLVQLEANACARILQSAVDGDAVDGRPFDFLRGHFERIADHEELASKDDVLSRYAAQRAARHLLKACDIATSGLVHLGALMRFLDLALEQCIPVVRMGGRQPYAAYNDVVFGWLVRCYSSEEIAHARLVRAQEILEFLPKRTELDEVSAITPSPLFGD